MSSEHPSHPSKPQSAPVSARASRFSRFHHLGPAGAVATVGIWPISKTRIWAQGLWLAFKAQGGNSFCANFNQFWGWKHVSWFFEPWWIISGLNPHEPPRNWTPLQLNKGLHNRRKCTRKEEKEPRWTRAFSREEDLFSAEVVSSIVLYCYARFPSS